MFIYIYIQKEKEKTIENFNAPTHLQGKCENFKMIMQKIKFKIP